MRAAQDVKEWGDHWTKDASSSAALWGIWLLLAVQGLPPPMYSPASFSPYHLPILLPIPFVVGI